MLFKTAASADGANMKKSEKLAVESLSYYVSFEIMNRIYNTSLLDPDSPDYKKMYSEVSNVVSVHFMFAFIDMQYSLTTKHLKSKHQIYQAYKYIWYYKLLHVTVNVFFFFFFKVRHCLWLLQLS